MLGLLLAAGLLLFSLGLVHSVLGEVLFFRHMESFQGFPSILGGDGFPKRTLRITWHIPSILSWAFASILIDLAFLAQLGGGERFVVKTIALSQLLCALMTFGGTKGEAPRLGGVCAGGRPLLACGSMRVGVSTASLSRGPSGRRELRELKCNRGVLIGLGQRV